MEIFRHELEQVTTTREELELSQPLLANLNKARATLYFAGGIINALDYAINHEQFKRKLVKMDPITEIISFGDPDLPLRKLIPKLLGKLILKDAKRAEDRIKTIDYQLIGGMDNIDLKSFQRSPVPYLRAINQGTVVMLATLTTEKDIYRTYTCEITFEIENEPNMYDLTTEEKKAIEFQELVTNLIVPDFYHNFKICAAEELSNDMSDFNDLSLLLMKVNDSLGHDNALESVITFIDQYPHIVHKKLGITTWLDFQQYLLKISKITLTNGVMRSLNHMSLYGEVFLPWHNTINGISTHKKIFINNEGNYDVNVVHRDNTVLEVRVNGLFDKLGHKLDEIEMEVVIEDDRQTKIYQLTRVHRSQSNTWLLPTAVLRGGPPGPLSHDAKLTLNIRQRQSVA